MANSTESNRSIYLDDFTSAISLTNLKIMSIEWVGATTFGHTCTISLGASGPKFIEWTCHDVNFPYIKYFDGLPFKDIYIGVSGVQSGSVIIVIR